MQEPRLETPATVSNNQPTDYYSYNQTNSDQQQQPYCDDRTHRNAYNANELPISEILPRQPPPMPDFNTTACHRDDVHIPPPPPPPTTITTTATSVSSSNLDLVDVAPIRPNAKMKSLNWKKIPKRKVLSSVPPINNVDTTNVWYMIAKTNNALKEIQPKQIAPQTVTTKPSKIREILNSVRRKKTAAQSEETDHQQQSKILAAIDFNDLETLFCLPQQHQQQQQLNQQFNNSSLGIESPNFIRRASVRTNASSDAFSSWDDQDRSSSEDQHTRSIPLNLLDSKKSLNVNIFLKQCRSSHESLIRLINEGNSIEIGKEKLDNLLKILPDTEEERSLRDVAVSGDRRRLPLAESFLLRLITKVPNYRLRLESLLLQEEYRTNFDYLKNSVKVIESAAEEIQNSQQFRDILNLVLVTGNFLNSGGYAADAAGFTLDCLSRLSEVRSNKQGIFLIHYVAEIAEKLRLNNFIQEDIPHIEEASKVCVESLRADVKFITLKLVAINNLLNECELENDDNSKNCISNQDERHEAFFYQLQKCLDEIRLNIDGLRRDVTQGLEEVRVNLANYLCEDVDSFKFSECFNTLIAFNQRLKIAIDENRRRKESEKRLESKRSFALKGEYINGRSECDQDGHQTSGGRKSLTRTMTYGPGDNVLESVRTHNDLIELLRSTNINSTSCDNDSANFQTNNRHEPFGTFKRTKKGLKSTVQAYFKSCDGDATKETNNPKHGDKRAPLLSNPSKLENLFSRERDSGTENCKAIQMISPTVATKHEDQDYFKDVTNQDISQPHSSDKNVTIADGSKDASREESTTISMTSEAKLDTPQSSDSKSSQTASYKNPTFSRGPPHSIASRRVQLTTSPIKETNKNIDRVASISQKNTVKKSNSPESSSSSKYLRCKSSINKIPVTNGVKVLPESFTSKSQKKLKTVARSHSITSQSSSKSGSTSSHASNKSRWISSTRVINNDNGNPKDKISQLKSNQVKSSELRCKAIKNELEQKQTLVLRKESPLTNGDTTKLKRATSMKARLSGILNGEARCGSSFMRPTSASNAKLRSFNTNSSAIR